MSSTRSRLLAAGAMSLFLMAVASGCGGGGGDTAPSGAATQTPSAASLIAPDAFADRVVTAIEGTETVHMEIDGGSFLNATADLAYGADPASRITASLFGGTQVIVVADGVVYLQTSAGAKFLVVDEDTPTLGPLIGTFTTLGPRESVDGIRQGISEVSEVGPVRVNGAELTEYRVTVDTAKLSGALKLVAGTSGVSEEMAMQFFLDDSGLLNEIRFTITGEPVSITFTDWDKPVSIQAPAAAQVQ